MGRTLLFPNLVHPKEGPISKRPLHVLRSQAEHVGVVHEIVACEKEKQKGWTAYSLVIGLAFLATKPLPSSRTSNQDRSLPRRSQKVSTTKTVMVSAARMFTPVAGGRTRSILNQINFESSIETHPRFGFPSIQKSLPFGPRLPKKPDIGKYE
jgi:hypothetical protein